MLCLDPDHRINTVVYVLTIELGRCGLSPFNRVPHTAGGLTPNCLASAFISLMLCQLDFPNRTTLRLSTGNPFPKFPINSIKSLPKMSYVNGLTPSILLSPVVWIEFGSSRFSKKA